MIRSSAPADNGRCFFFCGSVGCGGAFVEQKPSCFSSRKKKPVSHQGARPCPQGYKYSNCRNVYISYFWDDVHQQPGFKLQCLKNFRGTFSKTIRGKQYYTLSYFFVLINTVRR